MAEFRGSILSLFLTVVEFTPTWQGHAHSQLAEHPEQSQSHFVVQEHLQLHSQTHSHALGEFSSGELVSVLISGAAEALSASQAEVMPTIPRDVIFRNACLLVIGLSLRLFDSGLRSIFSIRGLKVKKLTGE